MNSMNTLARFLINFNAWIIQATGGRIGSNLAGMSILLLETIGRKSGRRYVTPLAFFRDGANYIIVASNGGSDRDPQWYRNLLARPQVTIQLRGRTIIVEARTATEEEYPRLWELVTRQNPMYLGYQNRTRRRIPLVILSQPPDYGYPGPAHRV